MRRHETLLVLGSQLDLWVDAEHGDLVAVQCVEVELLKLGHVHDGEIVAEVFPDKREHVLDEADVIVGSLSVLDADSPDCQCHDGF